MANDRSPGPGITRRDFIGSTLIGAGAALLTSPPPARAGGLGAEWTGYGGVGDYAASNGNTAGVVDSAHRIRDHQYDAAKLVAIDLPQVYDTVVVGGGFSGIAAQYEFQKRRPGGTCLLLENHPIFGGFAKPNEFDVDGYRLAGPQASINFLSPEAGNVPADGSWHELGLPDRFDFAAREDGGTGIVFPRATSAPLYYGEQTATVGYFFANALTQGKGRWIRDIWDGDLNRAPMPEGLKRGLRALRDRRLQFKDDAQANAWLDSMSFADLVVREMKLDPSVLDFVAPVMGTSGMSPQVSAYEARSIPFVGRFEADHPIARRAQRWMSFPGGNAAIFRHFVKALYPDAIPGPRTLRAITSGPVDLSALDRAEAACQLRLGATVVRVAHEGDPGSAQFVNVVYEKGGQLYRVRAKAAVLCIGSWVAKHVVAELPSAYRTALGEFCHAPILMINVALRNWRFMAKLGIASARWFDGFGFFGTLRQPMIIDGTAAPFHPDKPAVMTFYVPVQRNDLPLAAQGPAGRAQLYATSYAAYEQLILGQMRRLFASSGFDARRDVAGIVLNRWGHALINPPPGFYFGKAGERAPREVLQERFGRISFGHSELGALNWEGAMAEGRRAISQALATL